MTMEATKECPHLHNLTRSAHKIIPHLRCADVNRTAAFYLDNLHFELGGLRPEVPMVSVFMGRKAEANIYIFGKQPSDGHAPTGTIMVGLGKAELEQYYQALLKEKKVDIVHTIEDRPWGFRQFDVKDLDGNVLQFFAFIE